MSYGPSLPPGFSREDPEKDDEEEEEEEEEVPLGPALPPGLQNNSKASKESSEEEEDDDVIGPLPPKPGSSCGSSSASSAALDIIKRSQNMKDKIEGVNQTKDPKREEWMLSLPPEKAKNFGLGPRTFSKGNKSEKCKDRSVWTDTPEQKAKKARGEAPDEAEQDPSQDPDVLAYMASLQRDNEMQGIYDKLSGKRGNSTLVEIHDKKRKKIAKENPKQSEERRPFDRDVDLQVNRFDKAQRNLMLKRAGQLNDKFSGGSQKFL